MPNNQQQQPAKQPLDIVRNDLPTLEKILSLSAAPGTDVATIAAQEFMYLEAIAQSKPEVYNCTPQSILLAVKGVMRQNLTLDPYAGLVYTKTRNVNIGTQQAPIWAKVLEMMPTANGLISINRQLGRILDYTNPEVKKDITGKVVEVSMKILKPSYGAPRWETYTFDESDFTRWQRASHKENARNKQDADANKLNYANPNYTNWKGGIDPEFARAKCIRHSLKKLGTNPQEVASASVKVAGVPQDRVIDPEKDEYVDTQSGEMYTDVIHEELNSTLGEPINTDDLPNTNDL